MIPTGAEVYVATRPVDFRMGPDGLVRDGGADPFSGALYVFPAKRAQHATFCIQSSKRDDCISVASPFWTNASSRTVPTRQGFEVHLYGGTAGV